MPCKYPAWWKTTITLYNKVTDNGKIIYYRHLLDGCHYAKKRLTDSDGGNLSAVSETVVRIRQSNAYLPPKAYADSGAAVRKAHFTLTPGDVVFYGDVTDDMADETGKRPSDLLKNQDGFTVKTCADNTFASPAHYRCGD